MTFAIDRRCSCLLAPFSVKASVIIFGLMAPNTEGNLLSPRSNDKETIHCFSELYFTLFRWWEFAVGGCKQPLFVSVFVFVEGGKYLYLSRVQNRRKNPFFF